MALFQQSVLKKYLSLQDSTVIQSQYKKYKRYFHDPKIQDNIRASKEEEYQGIFLTELFVKVLGYTMSPNANFDLVAEFKNETNSRKADGAILKNGKAIAVIELKGTNTKDLEKIRQQAFDYKSNQSDCVYVITSNFEKLRFYVHNAVDHIEFDLFHLSQDEFSLLYLSLAKNSVINDLPNNIKQDSLRQEKSITDKLYFDYSLFKRELFRDLVKLNMNNSVFREQLEQHETEQANKTIKLTLFKKSQKLIDRFLFIFFAEDRLLLPPNSTVQILKKWNTLKDLDAYTPLYERFKQYFNYLDTGRVGTDKQAEIYAYNGGLFKPDPVLDALSISDNLLLAHSNKISEYDFSSQVDVNILGHIFENSLNEIESVNAEIEGVAFDKQKTKRKQDGVFYTPKYITKYIVDNTVGKLCREKRTEYGVIEEQYLKGRTNRKRTTIKALYENVENYRVWLLSITICDPACGSGAFLNQALDYLITEHAYLDGLISSLMGTSLALSNVETTILENNIFGVDLNEESVEIAKLSLWLRTAQPRRKLNDLSNNIKCGNSLVDSKALAGDKAFNWREQFRHVFDKGGFDVVIGNPPYVYARGIDERTKLFLIEHYNCAAYQIDLYILFLELSESLINNHGLVSFIVPNTWLNNLSLEPVRRYLLDRLKFLQFVTMPVNVFLEANVDTVITIFKKDVNSGKVQIFNCVNSEFHENGFADQNDWYKNSDLSINIYLTREISTILKKVAKNSISFDEIAEIIRGVGVYHKRIGHTKEFIKSDPFQSTIKKDDTFVPYLRGRNLSQWEVNWGEDSFISYGNWLAEPRESRYFNGPRILIRKILSKGIVSAFIDEKFVVDQQIYTAIFNSSTKIKEQEVLALICSKLMVFYFCYSYSEFDELFPQIKLAHVKKLPIINPKINNNKKLFVLACTMIDLKTNFSKKKNNFNKYISSKFDKLSQTKKLRSWNELDFGGFITELNNAIIKENKERIKAKKIPINKLTKLDEMGWMEVFETKKIEAQSLKAKVEKVDKEIDKMVYTLYGLTYEEIQIVERM